MNGSRRTLVQGIAALSGSPEQFAAFIRSEIVKYGDVIRKGGIEAEG